MPRLAHLPLGLVLILALAAITTPPALAGDRIPGDAWMRFADPADAGFDPALLEAAHATWEGLPSSAFMVIADGAVVAAWGDVDRRFMCHSVRKSFLSALYGIYWDRGEIELNKTWPTWASTTSPARCSRPRSSARILDLLKARSGVFHTGRLRRAYRLAAPRAARDPGRYFAYNNWDFNTLATILEQETGASTHAWSRPTTRGSMRPRSRSGSSSVRASRRSSPSRTAPRSIS